MILRKVNGGHQDVGSVQRVTPVLLPADYASKIQVLEMVLEDAIDAHHWDEDSGEKNPASDTVPVVFITVI